MNDFSTLICPHYVLKGKTLKFTTDLESFIQEYGEIIMSSIKSDVVCSYRFLKKADWAFSEDFGNTIIFRKIDNRWFRIIQDASLQSLLCKLLGERLAGQLISYTTDSINKLVQASTYSDVESDNKPIRIVRRSKPEFKQPYY